MCAYLILQVVTVMWLLIIQITVVPYTSSRRPGRAVIHVVPLLYLSKIPFSQNIQ